MQGTYNAKHNDAKFEYQGIVIDPCCMRVDTMTTVYHVLTWSSAKVSIDSCVVVLMWFVRVVCECVWCNP